MIEKPPPSTFSLSMARMTSSSVMGSALDPLLLWTSTKHEKPVPAYGCLCMNGVLRGAGLEVCRQRTATTHIDKAHEGLHLHESTIEGARGQACLHNLHPQLIVEVPKAQHLQPGMLSSGQACKVSW